MPNSVWANRVRREYLSYHLKLKSVFIAVENSASMFCSCRAALVGLILFKLYYKLMSP